MDLGRVLEDSGRGTAPQTQQHSYQTSPVSTLGPAPFRSYEGFQPPPAPASSAANASLHPSSFEVWTGAVARLQTQVSMNTSMLESHRRQVSDIEQAVGRLQQEMGNVVLVLQEVRAELQARPLATAPFSDSRELVVLSSQLATVASKADEIDDLKVQLDRMKDRLKGVEHIPAPVAGSGQRDSFEMLPVQQHPVRPIPPVLPPMRTAPPPEAQGHRPHGMPPMPQPHAIQLPAIPQPHVEQQPPSSEYAQSSPPALFGSRPVDSLPPPSSFAAWRPTGPSEPAVPPRPLDALSTAGLVAPPTTIGQAQTTGWAPVKQSVKRSLEEPRYSPYGQPASAPGSPKRPRLAPIIPRSGQDERMVQSPVELQSATSMFRPDIYQSQSRAQSGASEPHALPTPASTLGGSFRFVVASNDPEASTNWQTEPAQATSSHDSPPSSSRGGRARTGRGRGGRGRGSRDTSRRSLDELHELQDPEHPRVGSADLSIDYGLGQRAPGVLPGGSTDSLDQVSPATPRAAHPPDALASAYPDLVLSSSGKKSRTKPIRNADGVLIRKDGRPDMRSVSSANNLRKVHAKREAERAEGDTKPSTSARSLAPAHSDSYSSEDAEGRSIPPPSSTPASPADKTKSQRSGSEGSRGLPVRQSPRQELGSLPDHSNIDTADGTAAEAARSMAKPPLSPDRSADVEMGGTQDALRPMDPIMEEQEEGQEVGSSNMAVAPVGETPAAEST